MSTKLLIALFLFALTTPAAAQVVVITNADLGKPVTQQIAMTPAQWQNFVAHQFTYVPPSRPDYGGGRVAVSGWTPPTAEALQRPTYPLQAPFYMSTYVGPTFGVYPLGPSASHAPAAEGSPAILVHWVDGRSGRPTAHTR